MLWVGWKKVFRSLASSCTDVLPYLRPNAKDVGTLTIPTGAQNRWKGRSTCIGRFRRVFDWTS